MIFMVSFCAKAQNSLLFYKNPMKKLKVEMNSYDVDKFIDTLNNYHVEYHTDSLIYKVFDSNRKLLAMGEYNYKPQTNYSKKIIMEEVPDSLWEKHGFSGNDISKENEYVIEYYQNGFWKEYYENGKLKLEGYYQMTKDHSQKIGIWRFYYPNGNLQETYSIGEIEEGDNISFCMNGFYICYFENEQIKSKGFYTASRTDCVDTVMSIDPITGIQYIKIKHKECFTSEKSGDWKYFNEKGILINEEQYD